MKNLFLRVAISVFFIGLLFFMVRDDFAHIANVLQTMNKPLCLISAGMFLLTALVLARRLQLIFKAENVSLSFVQVTHLTFVGYFFNNFLPTSVGGDIVKAICAARLTKEPVKSVTTVLMDRIFGSFTFILIPSITLVFFMQDIKNRAVPIIVYSLLMVSIFAFIFLFNRSVASRFSFIGKLMDLLRIGKKMRTIYDGLHNFRNHRGVVAQAMALSVIGQSLSIFVLFILSWALGARVGAVYFFLLVPVVHLISMLPSLNGLGIREGAYVYFLAPYLGRGNAAALSILWLGLLFMMSIIGGIIYLSNPQYHFRFKEASKLEEETS